jgi:hypothetical protein
MSWAAPALSKMFCIYEYILIQPKHIEKHLWCEVAQTSFSPVQPLLGGEAQQ